MKKCLLLFALALLVSFNGLFAATVSVEKANTIAVNFFKVNTALSHVNVSATLYYTQTEADNTVDFYVFNVTPGPGFVIVAADDNIEPILAYSNTSNFETGLNKTGVVDWMSHAAKHVYRGIRENLPATTHIRGAWTAYNNSQKPADMKSTVVAPLVYTNWNQEPLYNAYCPLVSGGRTVTGCVATTMAQIMKYWGYPARGTGAYSYNDGPTPYYSNNIGTLSANFADSTYNWAAMPISITTVNTNIASLMLQCGISVGMDYGTDAQNGSGAQVIAPWGGACAQTAYTSYFSYNPSTIQGVTQRDYSATDWFNLMKTDLDAGRPIQYVGADPSAGGHTWVCDGYDGNGLLHMNWGWGGSANGYYAVNALSAGGYNFSTDEQALIGIEPLTPVANAATHITICAGDTAKLTAQLVNHASYSWTPTLGLACTTCAYTMATPAGTTVYVAKIDSAGTIKNTTYIVSVTPRVTGSATMVNLTCKGAANGVIDVTAAGGIPTYTYAWNNGLTSPTSNTLAAGAYSITITDAVGCSAVVNRTLTQPAGINVSTSTTPVSACATATGTALVNAWGGNGTLSYLWSNAATSTTISGLAAGAYTVTVTDQSNCHTITDVTIGQPDQIDVTSSSTNTINGQHVGTATIDVTGGNSPYTYAWSDGETSQSIANLEAGSYTVTVTDGNGCYETSSVTIVSTPAAAINTITDALSFSVYPNPAHSQTIVQLNKVANGTNLKLENILGQVLLNRPVTDMQTELDLAGYPDGVYLIEVTQSGKRAVKQIVISR